MNDQTEPLPVQPSMRLDGMTALITGAGRGLGVGAALAVADAGAEVILISRTAEELDSVSDEIEMRGRIARTAVCDVTDDAAVHDLFESLPKLDILVNNAGTNIPQPFTDVSADALDRMLALNVRAAFLVAQAATNRMLKDSDRRQRGGALIHISSQLGHVALRGRSVYTMTKHAVEGMSKAMALELAAHNIRSNCVGPTWVDTPMTRPALSDPAFRQEIIDSIPMGHLAQVGDIMGAIVFLASPAAGMITGQSLLVDGGWTAR